MEKSSQPSSPGVPPVSLKDCIEETLKLLFSNETLETDLGLSKDYCSHLLKDDDHDSLGNLPCSIVYFSFCF